MTNATVPVTVPTKPSASSGLLASVKGELQSRKWRAMIMQLGGALGVLIPNLDTVWGWILAGAMWAVALGSYILGVAVEDNGTKRGVAGDTNINVGSTMAAGAATVRTRRTSLTPVFADGHVTDQVETVETEVKGS